MKVRSRVGRGGRVPVLSISSAAHSGVCRCVFLVWVWVLRIYRAAYNLRITISEKTPQY
jgi:hypothetical protein